MCWSQRLASLHLLRELASEFAQRALRVISMDYSVHRRGHGSIPAARQRKRGLDENVESYRPHLIQLLMDPLIETFFLARLQLQPRNIAGRRDVPSAC